MTNQIQEALLRRKQVEALTGLTRSTIYALMADGKFPKPCQLVGRTVAWPASSINKWIAERIAASKSAAQGC